MDFSGKRALIAYGPGPERAMDTFYIQTFSVQSLHGFDRFMLRKYSMQLKYHFSYDMAMYFNEPLVIGAEIKGDRCYFNRISCFYG